MKALFKTTDVIKFLCNFDCNMTAEDLKIRAAGAEFVDSKVIRNMLIDEIYKVLTETVNQYTYLCK